MAMQRRDERVSAGASLRKGRRKNLLKRLLRSKMACIIILAGTVSFVLSLYVCAYARATENGYQKAELQAHLKELRSENAALRVQLDELCQPENVEAFATANGMVPSTDIAYIKPARDSHVARNTE